MKKFFIFWLFASLFAGCSLPFMQNTPQENFLEKAIVETKGILGEEKTVVGISQFVLLDEQKNILFLLQNENEKLKEMKGKYVVVSGFLNSVQEGSVPILHLLEIVEGWGNAPEKTKLFLDPVLRLSADFGTTWEMEVKKNEKYIYDIDNSFLFSFEKKLILSEAEKTLLSSAFPVAIPEKNWTLARAAEGNTTKFFLTNPKQKNVFFVFSVHSDLGKSALYPFFQSLKMEEKEGIFQSEEDFFTEKKEKKDEEKGVTNHDYPSFLKNFEQFFSIFIEKNEKGSIGKILHLRHARWNFLDVTFTISKGKSSRIFRSIFTAEKLENGRWNFAEKTRFERGETTLWNKVEGEIPDGILPSEFFLAHLKTPFTLPLSDDFLIFVSTKYLFSFAYPKIFMVQEIPQKNDYPRFEVFSKEGNEKQMEMLILKGFQEKIIKNQEGIYEIPRDTETHFVFKLSENTPENREFLQKMLTFVRSIE